MGINAFLFNNALPFSDRIDQAIPLSLRDTSSNEDTTHGLRDKTHDWEIYDTSFGYIGITEVLE
jgi:hypothetical protein